MRACLDIFFKNYIDCKECLKTFLTYFFQSATYQNKNQTGELDYLSNLEKSFLSSEAPKEEILLKLFKKTDLLDFIEKIFNKMKNEIGELDNKATQILLPESSTVPILSEETNFQRTVSDVQYIPEISPAKVAAEFYLKFSEKNKSSQDILIIRDLAMILANIANKIRQLYCLESFLVSLLPCYVSKGTSLHRRMNLQRSGIKLLVKIRNELSYLANKYAIPLFLEDLAINIRNILVKDILNSIKGKNPFLIDTGKLSEEEKKIIEKFSKYWWHKYEEWIKKQEERDYYENINDIKSLIGLEE